MGKNGRDEKKKQKQKNMRREETSSMWKRVFVFCTVTNEFFSITLVAYQYNGKPMRTGKEPKPQCDLDFMAKPIFPRKSR